MGEMEGERKMMTEGSKVGCDRGVQGARLNGGEEEGTRRQLQPDWLADRGVAVKKNWLRDR